MLNVRSALRHVFAATLTVGLFLPLRTAEAQNPLSFHSSNTSAPANGNDSAHRRLKDAFIKLRAHNFRRVDSTTIEFEIHEGDVNKPVAAVRKLLPWNIKNSRFALYLDEKEPEGSQLCAWLPRERTRPGSEIRTIAPNIKLARIIVESPQLADKLVNLRCAVSDQPKGVHADSLKFKPAAPDTIPQ